MPQVKVSAAIERKVFEVCLYWLMLSHGQMLDKNFEHLIETQVASLWMSIVQTAMHSIDVLGEYSLLFVRTMVL